MTRTYCKHCGERIFEREGQWLAELLNYGDGEWCRINEAHEPESAEEVAREALAAQHDLEYQDARWERLTKGGSIVAPGY